MGCDVGRRVYDRESEQRKELPSNQIVPRREPLLFTPGPLTTSHLVKQAMLVDLGSRDEKMIAVIKHIRDSLLQMANVSQKDGYECVLMQGSGTFTVESVIGSVIPQDGRLLVISNGAYGQRICQIARYYNIEYDVIDYGEDQVVDVSGVEKALTCEKYTHVAMVHHETTAGILNPVEDIGKAIHKHDPSLSFIVDSMSGFGAYPVNLIESNIDYLVSSANKNIEGVPGFAFALCRRDRLLRDGENARSLSLDLLSQWKGLENNGQFRFTPPTHALLAFAQALAEHKHEGGVQGRLSRYEKNANVLMKGMQRLGFKTLAHTGGGSCIITTFEMPNHPQFVFATFYKLLAERGVVIYPGKLTKADCFRIGTIGRIFESDVETLLFHVHQVLQQMRVKLPASSL